MGENLFYKLVDEIFTRRAWTAEDIRKYIGYYDSSYLLYSAYDDTRLGASSGGVISEILIYCLDNGIIDGALVCNTEIVNGKVRPKFFIAKTRDEVLSARGSKYIETRFVSQALPLIEEFNGKLAVVALPCDLKVLSRRIEKNNQIKNKVILKLGLFCGHNSEAILVDNISEKFENETGSRIVDFKFRVGSWRGKIFASFQNGTTISKKTNLFTDYQNLFFFAQKKCFYCNDHFAYFSDISAGDMWAYYLKDYDNKYNSIISRNAAATSLVLWMIRHNHLVGDSLDINEILNGQSRGVRLHHNLHLKKIVGSRFGVNIPVAESDKESFKWHEYVVAWIVFFNWRWSRSKWSYLVFKIPRPLLKLYLYFLKGLQSLK